MMVSTVILCFTYAVIIWDKLNRAIVALLGASVMVVITEPDFKTGKEKEKNSLLSRQEAFFKHVQKWFWYLQEQYRVRTGALRSSSLVHQLPPTMARPPAHN